MRTRLALVGAPSIFRDGLRALLGSVEEFVVVDEAPSLREAVRATGRRAIDVLLVDTGSVEADWIERIAQLVDLGPLRPAPRMLLLVNKEEDSRLVQAAAAGVNGWVLKEEGTPGLFAAIRAVSSGGAWLPPPVARQLLDGYRSGRGAPGARAAAAEAARLSKRELSVLRLLAEGRSNAEIARALVLGESTVKTHVSRMLAKLELRDRVQLAAFAHRNGLAE